MGNDALSARAGQQPELQKKRSGRRTAGRSEANVRSGKSDALRQRRKSEETTRDNDGGDRAAGRQELTLGQLGDNAIVGGLAGVCVKQPVKLRGTAQRDQHQPKAEHQTRDRDTNGRATANRLPSNLQAAGIKQ